MFWFIRLSLGLLLLHLTAAYVFLDSQAANQVFNRKRRANSLFEEWKQGNMERECIEERCSWEEAREIFEDKQKTDDFWAKYVDGDACESTPCANGGRCQDGIGSYTCYCHEAYRGFNCEIVIPQLCENNNGGCQHFCAVIQGAVQCACADGYFLASNAKSCHSNVTYKCGAIVSKDTRTIIRYERENTTKGNTTELEANASATIQPPVVPERATMTRIVNGEDCPPGDCPWQALLVNEDDIGFCGGTILNEHIILTAAHCMNQSLYFNVRLGEFDRLKHEGSEADHYVEAILAHRAYKPDTYHNDIALVKLTTPIKFSRFIVPACIPEPEFAEKVLMQEPDGMVSGFGRLGEGREPSPILQRLSVPYVDRRTCMDSTLLRISARMFCAGYDTEAKDACQGDSGGPHVTRYHGTYFITGIVSWGEGCARKGKYGVYTQVSKYVPWIREGMTKLMHKDTTGSRMKRHHGPMRRLYL